MRKVIVQKWDLKEGQRRADKVDVCEAVFHAWGTDYDEFEAGPGNYCAAIVEHADGQVETVPAGLIKFISGEI